MVKTVQASGVLTNIDSLLDLARKVNDRIFQHFFESGRADITATLLSIGIYLGQNMNWEMLQMSNETISIHLVFPGKAAMSHVIWMTLWS